MGIYNLNDFEKSGVCSTDYIAEGTNLEVGFIHHSFTLLNIRQT